VERLTIDDAARVSGRGPRELRLLIESGELPATRRGGRWLIEACELERLVPAVRAAPPPAAERPASDPNGMPPQPRDDELAALRARLDRAEVRITRLEQAGPAPDGRPPAMRDALLPLFGRTEPAERS
jgi:excisionase family DNA binding protein